MPTSVRIHEAQIASFLAPGQPIDSMLVDVAQDGRNIARGIIAAHHSRTGDLFRNISGSRKIDKFYSPIHGSTFIAANLYYAIYVEEGTAMDGTGFITGNGRPMAVPYRQESQRGEKGGELKLKHIKSGGKFPKRYTMRDAVRGQRGVHFLRKGRDGAMAKFRVGG